MAEEFTPSNAAATLIETSSSSKLDAIITYLSLIKSLDSETKEIGYINRSTVALSTKVILKQEWKMFCKILNSIRPYIEESFKSIKVSNKNYYADFETERNTHFQIAFALSDDMKNIPVHTHTSASLETISTTMNAMNSISNDIAKETKRRKLIYEP